MNVRSKSCDVLATEWNEANDKGDIELKKKIEKKLWMLRLICERYHFGDS